MGSKGHGQSAEHYQVIKFMTEKHSAFFTNTKISFVSNAERDIIL